MKRIFWGAVFPLTLFVVLLLTQIIEAANGKGTMIFWGPILWLVVQILKWLFLEPRNQAINSLVLTVQFMLITSSLASTSIAILSSSFTVVKSIALIVFLIWSSVALKKISESFACIKTQA